MVYESLTLAHNFVGWLLVLLAGVLALDVFRNMLREYRKYIFYLFILFGILVFLSGVYLIYKDMHTNIQIAGGVLGLLGYVLGILSETEKIKDNRTWYATFVLLLIAALSMIV